MSPAVCGSSSGVAVVARAGSSWDYRPSSHHHHHHTASRKVGGGDGPSSWNAEAADLLNAAPAESQGHRGSGALARSSPACFSGRTDVSASGNGLRRRTASSVSKKVGWKSVGSKDPSRSLVLHLKQRMRQTHVARPERPSAVAVPFTRRTQRFADFTRTHEVVREEPVDGDIAAIALPAMAALAFDPLASLCDTAFIGRIGAVAQASVGVGVFPVNFVTKLFNLPLANITSTLVASADFQSSDSNKNSNKLHASPVKTSHIPSNTENVVTSALALAAVMGMVQIAGLMTLSVPIISAMGAPVGSAMHAPAVNFLRLRAVGCLPTIIAMVSQAIFRGFGDTKTPLYLCATCNVLNIMLDALFIFGFKWGIVGAATATLAVQFGCAAMLLTALSRRVRVFPRSLSQLSFTRFAGACGVLVPRTFASIATTTLAASLAARLGPTAMAAHQICFMLWLAASMLADSLAFAAQTLLGRALAAGRKAYAKTVTQRTVALGAVLGGVLMLAFTVFQRPLASYFTSDPAVLAAISTIMPVVALTMPLNTIAFTWDGALFGTEDFGFSAIAMIVAAVPAVAWMLMTTGTQRLMGIWGGLAMFMAIRAAVCSTRYATRSGPWANINTKWRRGGGERQESPWLIAPTPA
eukprot:jgi/Chlat1/5562/Chrsp369S00847